MLKIDSVNLRNVVVFENATLDLTPGVTVIRGRNLDRSSKSTNAVGKTLLLSPLRSIFFESSFSAVNTRKSAKTFFNAEAVMQVNFNLPIDGKASDVSISQFVKGKSLKYEIIVNGQAIAASRQTEVLAYIRQLVPLNYDEFSTFVHILPQPGVLFDSNAKRYDFFESIFNLTAYDAAYKKVVREHNEINKILIGLATKEEERVLTLGKLQKALNAENEDDLPTLKQQYARLEQQRADLLVKADAALQAIAEQAQLAKSRSRRDVVVSRLEGILEQLNLTKGADIPALFAKLKQRQSRLKDKLASWRKQEQRGEAIKQAESKIAANMLQLGLLQNDQQKKPPDFAHVKELVALAKSKGVSVSQLENMRKADVAPLPKDLCKGVVYGSLISDNKEQAFSVALQINASNLQSWLSPAAAKELAGLDKYLQEHERQGRGHIDPYSGDIVLLKSEHRLVQKYLDFQKETRTHNEIAAHSKEAATKLEEQLQYQQEQLQELKAENEGYVEEDGEALEEKIDQLQQRLILLRSAHELTKELDELPEVEQVDISAQQRVVQDVQAKVSALDQCLSMAEFYIKALDCLEQELLATKKMQQTSRRLEGMRLLFDENGLRALHIQQLLNQYQNNLNLYAPMIYGEPINFTVGFKSGTKELQFLARRNNLEGDVRSLSQSETRAFLLLNYAACLPFIPPNKRVDTLIMDEIESGLDAPSKHLLASEFVPALQELTEKIIFVTPMKAEEFYIDNARTVVVEKCNGRSRLQITEKDQ